jgi:hypothetical protein
MSKACEEKWSCQKILHEIMLFLENDSWRIDSGGYKWCPRILQKLSYDSSKRRIIRELEIDSWQFKDELQEDDPRLIFTSSFLSPSLAFAIVPTRERCGTIKR